LERLLTSRAGRKPLERLVETTLERRAAQRVPDLQDPMAKM